ncbi:Histone_H2B [Hexamita inflata]|uniref:Histone H2B n=1 Tax=Hexamita inflata TaxID=28002 RepID=A0AA86NTX2_9EUKA|nr:Histone H2B [Hexamita inflata]
MSDVKPIQKKSERKAKRVETYGTYILKVLKAIESEDGKGQKDVGVSKRCMEAMNSPVNDLFERISTEASILARKSHHVTPSVK